MSGSALKLAVIVLALVTGGLVLANGFDDPGLPRPAPDGEPEPTTTQTTTTPPPTDQPPTCEHQGRVFIYNGTQQTGLAAFAAEELVAAGYTVPTETGILNADSAYDVTEIHFRGAADRVEAECIAAEFMPAGTVITRLAEGSEVPENVRIAIYLGNDYAAENPLPN